MFNEDCTIQSADALRGFFLLVYYGYGHTADLSSKFIGLKF